MTDLLAPIAIYALTSTAAFYLLWILYLAVMNLDRAKRAGTLSKTAGAK